MSDGGVVLDRSVASVEGRVITLSQLQFEARVMLISAGGTEAAFAELTQDDLARSLNLAIDQRVATLEADKLEAYQLESGELEREVAKFREQLGGDTRLRKFLEAYEADVNDLGLVLKRAIRAQRALDGKLRLKAQVTEADARRAQAERAELRKLPLAQVRELLFAQRFRELVQAELKSARKAVDVRLLGPFSRQSEAR